MATHATRSHAYVSDSRHHVSDGIEKLGRSGYAAQGVIYFVIGILALRTAVYSRGDEASSTQAVREIAEQPFGRVLLGLVALGLIAYVIWRFVQAFMDPENIGSDSKGMVKRLAFFVSGLAYASLAILAASIALGMGGGAGAGGSEDDWTARLMAAPFGRWLVALVGLIIVGVGISNLIKSVTAKFMDQYNRATMSAQAHDVALWSGRAGLAARAVTFWIIGAFLLVAAYQADPNEARGLAGALQTMLAQPYGPWLLALVALGFMAFGVHCFMKARYRDFNVHFNLSER